MRSVSNKWKQNQAQEFVGECDVKVIIDVTDPVAVADATATANTLAYFSKPQQIMNNKDKDIKEYATLEQNFFLLDGNNRILPPYNSSQPLSGIGDTGYISNAMSGDDCVFTTHPTITLSFSKVFETTIPAITIIWDRHTGEYARAFTVTVYNGSTVVLQHSVTDNETVESILYGDFDHYDSIVIEISEWCKPKTRARIADVDVGISKEFFKESIVSMSFIEEVDAIGAAFPTNTIKFELDNSDDFFNPYNPLGFYRYLTKRQRVIGKVGYYNSSTDKVEWIQMGEYYLSNWNSPQNSITANFEANNLLSFLNSRYISTNITTAGVTLYSLAYGILSTAGLRKNADGTDKFVIHSSLQSITTTGVLPICTQLEALQYIAQAACCVLYCDSSGNIHIEPINTTTTDYAITRQNSFKLPEVEVQKNLGTVKVLCYTNKNAADTTELFDGVLDITGDQDVVIEFASPTLDTASVTATVTGATSYSLTKYNNGCLLSIVGGAGEVSVLIEGKTIDTSSRIVSIVNDPTSDDEQVVDNPLITSYTHARNVGLWVKDWLIKRNEISADWRIDPRLDALDKITIDNKYDEHSTARVTFVQADYNGGFKGKMRGRLV